MISPIHPNKFPVTENIVDRDQLQAAYINRVLDDMDIKDMMAILYDYMDVEFDKYTVCLLYTSPSPRDATLSRMPSSA